MSIQRNVRQRETAGLFAFAVVAVVLAVGAANAGPLVPPAGPIVPTAKPLGEIEPRIAISETNTPGDADSLFKITQPGSYYVAGNITGVTGKHGIEIAASGVTVDLNGFALVGVPGSLTGVGVFVVIPTSSVAVVNGSVRNWDGSGVDLTHVDSSRVEHVCARGNDGGGILGGFNGVFSHCSAAGNAGFGFGIGHGSTVSCCSAQFNLGDGFLATVSSFDNCLASSNSGSGFNISQECTVTNSLASRNTGFGFVSFSGSMAISHCIATLNDIAGINVPAGSTVTSCTANDNTTSGIIAGSGCTITGCTTQSNDSSSGVSVGDGSSVIDCTSSLNAGDGIVVSARCVARGNICDGNGVGVASIGAGINATGSNNRIEGNTCTASDFGLVVTGTRNVILRNTCGINTANWHILANNIYGPIIDRTSPASAAVIGTNGAASTLTSTDPNANFSY